VTQILTPAKTYDVCIVGSGAGGGMAAKVLTEAGADCVMLEAGPRWDVQKDGAMFKWPQDSPRRGAGTAKRPFSDFLASYGGWEVEGEPFSVAPGDRFVWFRSRMLGGRTNHWGRVSLRFGPYDFKARSRDGLGDDWPITYQDLAPYYDKLDRLVGIFGSREGMPNEPDGVFQPPPRMRCVDLLVKKGCTPLGIPCIPARMSILTQPLNGRAPCHYCGQCGRGCTTNSNFSSTGVLLPPALATGRLQILTGAMASRVTTDSEGRATGVSYIRASDGREQRVRARIVVLAASACESARILLNSRDVRHPEGLANSSGAVGRHLTDSTGTYVRAHFPQLMDGTPHNEDGANGIHAYIPWWLDNRKVDFPRGYHIQFYGGRELPDVPVLPQLHRWNGGGYGSALKADYRKYYGSFVTFQGLGEMIPNSDSYCEIDRSAVDKWGIPVLRFHFKWSDHELKQVRHVQQSCREIVERAGGKVLDPMPGAEQSYGIAAGGEMIHEVGTTRMGASPQTSVLNAQCRAHDVPNLFVADGGPFVSNADKNPTWTILALAMRTSEFIAEERRKGNL
jgi:choline dehydrogenase-like flavoprotein